jgi:hypothetical protein
MGIYWEKKLLFLILRFSFFKKKNYSGGTATPLGHMGWPNHPLAKMWVAGHPHGPKWEKKIKKIRFWPLGMAQPPPMGHDHPQAK